MEADDPDSNDLMDEFRSKVNDEMTVIRTHVPLFVARHQTTTDLDSPSVGQSHSRQSTNHVRSTAGRWPGSGRDHNINHAFSQSDSRLGSSPLNTPKRMRMDAAFGRTPSPHPSPNASYSRTRKRVPTSKPRIPGPAGELQRVQIRGEQTDSSAANSQLNGDKCAGGALMSDFLTGPWLTMLRALDIPFQIDPSRGLSVDPNAFEHKVSDIWSDKSIEKVPRLVVMLKTYLVKDRQVFATFKDVSGEIEGCINFEVLDAHPRSLGPGAVMILSSVPVIHWSVRVRTLVVVPDCVIRVFGPTTPLPKNVRRAVECFIRFTRLSIFSADSTFTSHSDWPYAVVFQWWWPDVLHSAWRKSCSFP
eukprot:153529_1